MMRSDQAGMLLSGDLDLHSARDGLCHLALEGQYVAQLAVVLIGPDVLVGCAPHRTSQRRAREVRVGGTSILSSADGSALSSFFSSSSRPGLRLCTQASSSELNA